MLRLFPEEGMSGPLDEFRSFLHDRQVRGEVVVQDHKPGFLHGAVHLARHEAAGGHAEGLADGHADRRGDDSDDGNVFVRQFCRYFVHRIHRFIRCPERAVDQALAAADTAIHIDPVCCAEHSGDGSRGTEAFAGIASLAFPGVDGDDAGNLPFPIGFCLLVQCPKPPCGRLGRIGRVQTRQARSLRRSVHPSNGMKRSGRKACRSFERPFIHAAIKNR